ncbi:hypothetical protein D3C76_1747160 [compost metagenome]
MVLGPMLDFKSLLMMLGAFRFKFVIWLCLLLVVLVFIGSAAADFLIHPIFMERN